MAQLILMSGWIFNPKHHGIWGEITPRWFFEPPQPSPRLAKFFPELAGNISDRYQSNPLFGLKGNDLLPDDWVCRVTFWSRKGNDPLNSPLTTK